MDDNIVKTEIKLGEDSVKKIIVTETAKHILNVPGLIETFVEQILFKRPEKRYSYDNDPPTFYETILKKTIQPIIEEEVKKIAAAQRPTISKILKKAFKTKVIDNKEFENRIIQQLSKFTSNIEFYIAEK